ncbi:glycosyl hydrolase family 65 central catalytic domain-containing protein [Kalaharituber pfeilii]|nr:glycosyl hydrolase family 65 central catalytic domain-containing protein [Kalaharituber pfeilii]
MRIITSSLITFIFAAVTLVALSSSTPAGLHERQLSAPPPPNFDKLDEPHNIAIYDANTWTLTTSAFIQNRYQVQPYVANGYHGSRLAAEGMGFWIERNLTGSWQPVNGWPLDNPRQTVSTISGFWDSQHNTTRTNFPDLLNEGGESVISGIPAWSSLLVTTPDGDTYGPGVDNATVSNFRQSLSLRNGIVETSFTWTPSKSSPSCNMTYTVVAHRSRINLGIVRLDVSCNKATTLRVTDVLDGQGAQRTTFGDKGYVNDGATIWTSVKPLGISNVTAYEFSTVEISGSRSTDYASTRSNAESRPYVSQNESTSAQEWEVDLKPYEPVTVFKYVGIASSDAFPDDAMGVAQAAAHGAKRSGWRKLIQEHNNAWSELWDSADIIVPGDEELQIALRGTLYHLLANIRGGSEGVGIGDNSISVGGLSSDSYAGLVFWDADLWMYPGLLALYPDHASAINNYRYRLLPQALENARKYDRPGAMYPWTSARFGNCTGTGPCQDYQYHLNSDIAHSQWNYYLATGDKKWLKERGWPIIKEVANMWEGRVTKNASTHGQYWVYNMTDPDEYANHIINGAYTNAGVIVTLEFAMKAAEIVGEKYPAKWKDIAENMAVPYDYEANIVVEFQGMNGSVEIKQADVVLLNYPLEWRYNESQALGDMNFYARAQSPDGPAMTWAIFAINSAELEPHGCASYTYMLYGSQPYLREPYYQFSEQIIDDYFANGGTNPAFTFLTGHGGFLQVATHGFTGFRFREDAFYLDPSLPPQLSDGIEIRGMKFHGGSFDVNIGLKETIIARRKTKDKKKDSRGVKVRIGERNPKRGDYFLKAGEKLVIPTFRADLNGATINGNFAQCKPIVSNSGHVPGQYPLGAVDGSNATTWQPSTDAPSALTLDLGEIKPLRGAELNWGRLPPNKFTILTSTRKPDESDEGWTMVYSTDKVPITDPWDPDEALEIRNRIGNTTSINFNRDDIQGRWVRLVVEGSKGEPGVGAQVAEFALL